MPLHFTAPTTVHSPQWLDAAFPASFGLLWILPYVMLPSSQSYLPCSEHTWTFSRVFFPLNHMLESFTLTPHPFLSSFSDYPGWLLCPRSTIQSVATPSFDLIKVDLLGSTSGVQPSGPVLADVLVWWFHLQELSLSSHLLWPSLPEHSPFSPSLSSPNIIGFY